MSELSTKQGEAGDYEDFVRLFAELQVDDPVPSRAIWSAELASQALFLTVGGRNIAYAIASPHGPVSHLVHLVVSPAMRGQGMGRRLLLAVAKRLRAAGCTLLRLNVKAGNEPAIRLYSSMGLEFHHRSQVLRLPWSAGARLQQGEPAPSRETLRAFVPLPADDEALEQRHDLLPGQIARWRGRGELLLAVGDGLGFARFQAGLGAMPFRAQTIGTARILLEEMRAHAPPASSHTQVVIEGDDELALALRDAGGTLLYEILQMRGHLPDDAAS